jgi:superfamily II DNA or RNA helicase
LDNITVSSVVLHPVPVITLREHQSLAEETMSSNSVGKVILPTGGGKTMVFIKNTIEQFKKEEPQTVCVVAPRILLSIQLASEYAEYIDNAQCVHVHSGSNLRYYRTTKTEDLEQWYNIHRDSHKLIFTSYNSLKKITNSNIKIDTYHFDECHNSVKKTFFPHVVDAVNSAEKKYFFTATPKNSKIPEKKPGMNISEVYGDTICDVPMTDMVDRGFILPPHIIKKRVDLNENIDQMNRDIIVQTIEDDSPQKIIVSVRSTKYILSLLSETDFVDTMKDMDYHILHITAAHGAYIDGKSVKRNQFFRTLTEWGNDPDVKFVLLNYSIMGEGMNIPGLDTIIFLRNMDVINVSQTVGRVVRISKEDSMRIMAGSLVPGEFENYVKPHGKVVLPVYDDYSERVANLVESVVYKSFVLGQTVTAEIEK